MNDTSQVQAPARRRERGQILPVVAGGMVILLGIAALVVDLGFSWMLRRQEQNAADPGAVAAARHIKPSGGGAPDLVAMRRAACYYARLNGFFEAAVSDDGCVTANDSANGTLTVNYPPVGTLSGGYGGRPGFVQVIISREHPAFFGRLFGRTVDTVRTTAVAANSNGDSNSNSLVALDPISCSSGNVSGGSQVNVHPAAGVTAPGGYVQVNSNCGNANAPPDSPNVQDPGICGSGEGSGALKIDGSGSSLTAPQVNVRGTCVKANNNSFSSPLDEAAGYYDDPLVNLQPPPISPTGAECGIGSGVFTTSTGTSTNGQAGCRFAGGGGGGGGGGPTPTPSPTPNPSATPIPACSASATIITLQPGTYYGGWDIRNNVELRLQPGIYVIAGGGIKLNAGGCLRAVSGDPLTDARVMFYNTDIPAYRAACMAGAGGGARCQGAIDLVADTTFAVKAPNQNTCNAIPSTCPYLGILLWHDGKGSCQYETNCDVALGGQTALDIAGTIYAPTALVTLAGGAGVGGTAAVQIISWQWNITGGAILDMPYDPSQLYKLEQKGLVH